MADLVYHFTCTARLPWIVATKELRPGRNQVGRYPVDFLWATTREQGDRTAAAMHGGYRKGVTALVRLALPAEDFEPWPAVAARFPRWTARHIKCLEDAARVRGETNFGCWRVRAEPLPLSRVIQAEAKTYTGDWKPIELACLPSRDPEMRGICFDGSVYFSSQYVLPGEATRYCTGRLSLADWSGEYAV